MIIDVSRFVERERPYWDEYEHLLDRFTADPHRRMSLEEVERFDYLYRRLGADLTRIRLGAQSAALIEHLENLLARGYAWMHAGDRGRGARGRGEWWRWLLIGYPAVFRRRFGAFLLALAVTLLGAVFGGIMTAVDSEAKDMLIPEQFTYHLGSPEERVREEEEGGASNGVGGMHATFSSQLMANNIRVGLLALGLGFTFGLGTMVMLFYNGVILGVVIWDYVRAGESIFLAGWLLPHGIIELPAIFVGGQAGFVIARAMVGRGKRRGLAKRMQEVRSDVLLLAGGMAMMLVWAGLVESFLSQYHEPVLPYSVKIGFGMVEGLILIAFLMFAGRDGRGRAAGERQPVEEVDG